jgi:hypothetical protein
MHHPKKTTECLKLDLIDHMTRYQVKQYFKRLHSDFEYLILPTKGSCPHCIYYVRKMIEHLIFLKVCNRDVRDQKKNFTGTGTGTEKKLPGPRPGPTLESEAV